MHVLVIPSWYKNSENPMAGTFFEEQARALMKKGFKVGLFHVGFKSFSYSKPLLQEEYVDNGLITYYYNYKGIVPKLIRLNYRYLCIKAYSKFNDYVKTNGKPDILHAHSVFWGGIVARYISKKTGIPYIVTEHLTNFILDDVSQKADLYFAKQVFNQSAINIAVSTTFKEELTRKLGIEKNKFIVINNMVAPMFFADFKEKKINDNECVNFFTNSFISKRKNHKMLLEAFALFFKSYPNSKLIIGGDVVTEREIMLKKELINFCKKNEIDTHVTFLGSITREQVKTQLDHCHVFLLTSKYETFSVVLIEALAAGRPVISTNSKGPVDIITKQNGLLINSTQAVDFAEGMKNLVSTYNLYNQVEISDDCNAKFGEDYIIGQLINRYNKALNICEDNIFKELNVLHLFSKYPNSVQSNWLYNLIINIPYCKTIIAAEYYTKHNFYNSDFTYINNPLASITHYKETIKNQSAQVIDKIICLIAEKLIGGYSKFINQELVNQHADIAHAHFADVGCKYVNFIKQKKLPLVVSFYGYDYEYLPTIKPVYKKMYKDLFLKADKFICEGTHGVGILLKMGCPKEKIEVVRLGVNTDTIPFHVKRKNPNQLNLVQIAALREKKGHIYTLKAFHKALMDCPDMHLTFVGNGDISIYNELQDYIINNGLSQNITILKEIDFHKLHSYLTEFDVFIHPSCYSVDNDCEGGAPIVLLDAQASGLPIISTTHCDIPDEVINNETGLLTPEKNVEALSESIKTFYKMGQEKFSRYSEAARKHVEKNYSIKKNAIRLKRIYDFLINEYNKS